jgi:hypothetical protein
MEIEKPEREGLSPRQLVRFAGVGATLVASGSVVNVGAASADDDKGESQRRGDSRGRVWRAGNHHVHSEYSGEFDTSTNPPTFHKGAEAVYPIVTNAIMAKFFGLTWAMCTDHGGPTHSKVNLELAYPDLLRSRQLVPEVLQFWGMEFDTPAQDHHTLMIPRHDGRRSSCSSWRAGSPSTTRSRPTRAATPRRR